MGLFVIVMAFAAGYGSDKGAWFCGGTIFYYEKHSNN